jgi:5-formyltetrahydrofolate cyclo-ligase
VSGIGTSGRVIVHTLTFLRRLNLPRACLEAVKLSESKADLRAAILAVRRALSPREHRAEASALARHLAALVGDDDTVCAYVPVGSEPGSLEMIDSLHRRRVRVLLPVARHDSSGLPEPLQWGEYRPGALVAARFGLREPAEPWLPADAIAQAVVILVPALAVDRAGVRLGRGAGFYDRSLLLADPSASRIAVVRDDELVDRLPARPHDVPMSHALTPRRGLVALG